MKFGNRKVKGIIGMALAVLGGLAWFYDPSRISAFLLWGGAIVIMFSLNRRRRAG